MAHRIDFRIYFEDTDITGIVYHANYVKYFERGRSESLRENFSDLSKLMEGDDPCTFAVSQLNIRYRLPAKLDDVITVETDLVAAKGAKMVFEQKIWRGEELLADGQVVVAVITLDGRPRRMPEALAKRMAEMVG
ncbi:YbgC/FadM family acyl-CoA thioesterase [Parvularcula lutaonensis]|uniref:YbgC/FadM family acyl-CoA thioesterase n=1 Tax=Parvularcula lutaonensis TaxID=491923 RepID=A0ABV7M8M6_9PROT|nr:YbgC/FadM family acyl-CoA thioesterase [Parvularcula lutaonensis]GGY44935.1 tol-pal system-associated acyl-CoA thioesterase [Parvularcula lutaonensis]